MRKDPKFSILNKSYLLTRSFVIFYFMCLKIRLRSPMFLQFYKLNNSLRFPVHQLFSNTNFLKKKLKKILFKIIKVVTKIWSLYKNNFPKNIFLTKKSRFLMKMGSIEIKFKKQTLTCFK